MFSNLLRRNPLIGGPRGSLLKVTDTCFVDYIHDNCTCHHKHCITTTKHLVALYERKKLNVARNVARYYRWLYEREWSGAISELSQMTYQQEHLLETNEFLARRFAKYYAPNIRQYLLKNNI